MFQVGYDLVTNQSVQRYQLSDDGIFEVGQSFFHTLPSEWTLVAASSGILRLRFLVWFGLV